MPESYCSSIIRKGKADSMKKILVILLIGFGIYQWLETSQPELAAVPKQSGSKNAANNFTANSNQDNSLATAFNNRQSNVQVTGLGHVIRILADDNSGSRHQKFILKLSSGQTLLIVHNIDLAPKIDAISKGDQVQFHGQYEWNPKGGVVHWTHHDPNARHPGGWLKHNGSIYQ